MRFLHRAVLTELASCDNVILIRFIEFAEVSRPSPNTDDEVLVIFGMLLGVKEYFTVYGVELELMSSESDERFDKTGGLLYAVVGIEHRRMELECERSAVYGVDEMLFCERLDYGKRSDRKSVGRERV